MPFSATPSRSREQLTTFFEHNLKQRIESDSSLRCSYAVHRSDNSFDITASIIRDLQAADIVICDLSGPDANPNVMYELGVRLATTHKPVVLIREMNPANRRIFDIAGFYAYEYEPPHYADVEAHILGKLRGFETGAEAFYSPVLNLLQGRSKWPRFVPLLVSAFLRQPFFAELLLEITRLLDVRGARAVVMVPHADYSSESQARQFGDVLAHADAYDGAIVLPIYPEREQARIEDFVNRFGRPVVFVDTPIAFLGALPKRVAFVGYDSAMGGAAAATAAATELINRQILAPHVVVVGAQVQRARQDAFIESIAAKVPAAIVSRHDNGDFDRELARRLVEQEIAYGAVHSQPVNLIFCTNDEMALGARAAVAAAGIDAVVIGYDAVAEATNLINADDKILRNSVWQDRQLLAEITVMRLFDLFDGINASVQASTILEPRLFRPSSNHVRRSLAL